MVPVRSGSTRVPQKNIRPFGDTNLLQLKLRLLKQLNGIKDIIVSTDCETSANIACISVTEDTFQDPIGPCGAAEQLPTGDTSIHALTPSWSSLLLWGVNAAMAVTRKTFT